MPILSSDIQFRASQVMDDVDNGGGRMTAVVLQDGASNEIFADISERDRAGGRVNVAKLFLHVDTPDVDKYLGANVIVSSPPADPGVSVTLFTTGDYFDHRTDAVDRIEAYLFAGPEWGGYLLENHIAGMSVVQLFQRVGSTLPVAGQTMVLVYNEGLATEVKQYIRVIKVSTEERTFTRGNGQDYAALIVTCDLSDVLESDFVGSPPSEYFTRAANSTKTRDTTVADAARYYGVTRLAAPVGIAELSAQVDSIFTQLVPSAQSETPLVSRTLNDGVAPMIKAAAAAITYTAAGVSIAPGASVFLRGPAYPGATTITVGGATLTDDGLGNVIYGGAVVGAWDYAQGSATLSTGAPTVSGTASVTYWPSAYAPNQAHTRALDVTTENRRLNWVETLLPIPAPGSLQISYRAQGNWYTLSDDGSGRLSGSDPGYGAGTVSYVTGDAPVTLGALPDVGAQILYTWASPVHYATHAVGEITTPAWEHSGAHQNWVPGSVTITWQAGGVTRTATDNGAGIWTGDASGSIAYAAGALRAVPALLPDSGSTPQLSYSYYDLITETATPTPDGSGLVTITAAQGPIKPGSVTLKWTCKRTMTTQEIIAANRV